MESFFKVIPREIVPKDYGGDQPTLKEMNGKFKTKALKPLTFNPDIYNNCNITNYTKAMIYLK